MKNLLALISILLVSTANAFTFKEAVKSISNHDIIQAMERTSKSISEHGNFKGSWGDPMLKVAARNFPMDTLDDDQTAMTGIEIAISQKVSLTTKYGNIKNAFMQLAKSKKLDSENKKRELIKSLWQILINTRKLDTEIKIISENLKWLGDTVKVSKRLYSSGKISQKALLDIQIRKSEIEAAYSNKKFELKQQSSLLGYLLGFEDKVLKKSIPWQILKKSDPKLKDLKQLSLSSKLESKKYLLSASKLNYIPDLTFSVGYVKRSNIDNNGDFIGASVSFPLPFSSKKYSNHSKAVHDKYSAIKKLDNYKRKKQSQKSKLQLEMEKVSTELKILNSRTIKFAQNSRHITSKSYSLGQSGYVELLQSELKLQRMLLKRSMLVASLSNTQVNLKYLLGENLYE
jgi:cobalt-zinc-cadmium efflux system outer membrane protein